MKFKYRKSMDEFEKLLLPTVYGNVPTFLGVPLAKTKEDLKSADAAIVGVPYLRSPPVGRELKPSVLDVQNLRKASLKYGGYLPELDIDVFEHLRLVDYGDVETVWGDVDESIRRTEKKVGKVVDSGCVPITIGTPPCACYPIVKTISDRLGKIGILHLDAHCDNLEEHRGDRWSGACWVSRISELKNIDMKNFVQVGIRGPRIFKGQIEWHRRRGSHFYTIKEIRERGIDEIAKEAKDHLHNGTEGTYVAVDFDVLDLGAGPGLDEPAGISTWELFKIVYQIGRGRLVGFSTEWIPSPVTPLYWVATWTILYSLAGMVKGVKTKGSKENR